MDFRDTYMQAVSVRKNTGASPDAALLIQKLYRYEGPESDGGERQAFLHLLASGNIFCEDLFSFSFRPMECFLMLYTRAGFGTLSRAGGTLSLPGNHLLVLDCAQRFTLQGGLLPWSFQILFFSGAPAALFGRLLAAGNAPLFFLPGYSALPKSLNRLLAIPCAVGLSDFLLMQQLLNEICTQAALSLRPHAARRADVPAYLMEIKDSFDNRFCEEFSLAAAQERYQVSRYRICREFAARFGEPPLRYLNRRRMDAAKEMLLTTELHVHEISSLVGIENASHFISLFKKYTGTTPGTFRQTAREALPEPRSPVR